MADVEATLKSKIVPETQRRISAAVGTDIVVEVDYASFHSCPAPARALQAIYSFNGYFVFERIASVIERLCKEGGPEYLRKCLKKIVVSNRNEKQGVKKVGCVDGVLHCRGDYENGSFGGFQRFKLRRVLERLTAFRGRSYKKEWADRTVPEFDRRMKDELKCTVPIEVEWSTFETGNSDEALQNLAYWWGSYSTYPIYYALQSLSRRDDFSTEDVMNAVKRVQISNIPGTASHNKIAYVENGTLFYKACFEESWYGTFSWWPLEQIIREAIVFTRLKPFSQLNEDKQKAKIEFLKDVATDANICNGHWEYLRVVAQHPAFWPVDEGDKTAIVESISQWHAAPEESKKKGDQGGKSAGGSKEPGQHGETFIKGWRVTKINYRGQEQVRLLGLTDKAMYTFKYDYAKKECDVKHSHRFDHTEYDYCQIVELKAQAGGGGGTLGALAGAASAVAAALAKPRYAFRMITNRKTKKGGLPIPASIIEKITKKVFGVMRQMVTEQLEPKDDLPELKLPGIPAYTTASLIKIANDTLGKQSSLPTINISGAPPAGLCDVLALLKESMDDLAKQPPIKLTNAPTITIPMVLKQLIDILDSMQGISLSLPDSPHLCVFLRQILDIIKAMKDCPAFKIPPPTPLPLVDLLQAIKTAITKEKDLEIPAISLPGFPALPPVAQIIDETCEQIKSAGLPDIVFPEFPSTNLVETLEKVVNALSGVTLPSFTLPKLDTPDIGLSMPAIPGAAIIAQLRGPPEPTYVELTAEPILGSEEDQGLFAKVVCEEIAWMMYGAVRAANRPYYQYQPYHTSYYVPSSTLTTVYNKAKMGKDNRPGNPA